MAASGGVLRLRGDAWLALPHAVDAEEVTFGAWIFLPSTEEGLFPHSSQSMKTIAGTKISGCKVSTESEGWGFFVHEWSTTNRQLRLSWTDSDSACHELYSPTNLVPYDTWVSVGFSFSKRQDRILLFLGNEVVADSRRDMGDYTKQGKRLRVSQLSIAGRHVARSRERRLYLGAHAPQKSDAGHEQSHCFLGYLADVRIIQESYDEWADSLQAIRSTSKDFRERLLPSSGQVVQVAFKKGQDYSTGLEPLISGAEDVGGGLSGLLGLGAPERLSLQGQRADGLEEVKDELTVVEWAEKMPPPLVAATGMEDAPSEPGPTLSPEELKATWPADWVQRWGEKALQDSQDEANAWADEVRQAMRHTWQGYKAKAWGRDDIKPDSGSGKDWCRMAVTMLDGLSTLWLMGLKEEFDDAYTWIASQNMPTPGKHGRHSMFEINIRALGGLLSAYSLSEKPAFLETARRLGDAMMAGFDTKSGIPKSTIDVGTGESAWHSWVSHAVLAEVATMQMEFRFLSHATGDSKYANAADKAFHAVLDSSNGKGLIPIYLSRDDIVPKPVGSKISLGAMGDSYYEYLIKQYVQSGKKEERYKNVWKKAMQEMQDELVVKTAAGRTFIAEKDGGKQRMRMDHLACFVAGMLMLGSRTLPAEEVDPRWEPLAGEITETCYQMYKRTPSGLSAEYYVFKIDAKADDMAVPNDAPHNLLRPEAIESVYYMWYYTGDPKYRKMAYEMWRPFQRHCKGRFGYSAVADVRHAHPRHRDAQESFWLAETLKYFYLVFAPRNTLDLDQWVFNTEAQPLRIWS